MDRTDCADAKEVSDGESKEGRPPSLLIIIVPIIYTVSP